jgi:hypothetical protein
MKAKQANASKRSAVTQPNSDTVLIDSISVKIKLPPGLVEWAEKRASDLSNTLSDLVRDVLEYEKLRDEKEHYTTCPRTLREFEAYRESQARKGGAR